MRSMFTPWKIGRLAGIDVFLHPTMLIIPLLIIARDQGPVALLFTAIVFGCVVLHELGHALMARSYGIATKDITLYPIGGVAKLERMPRSAGPELLIALAGPAVNLALAAIAWPMLLLAEGIVPWEFPLAVLDFIVWVNLGLLLFNMLPVFPMDGGRVLRALLSSRVGRLRATEIAAKVGGFIAMVAGVYFLLHGMIVEVFLALFIFVMGNYELLAVRVDEHRRRQAEGWPAPPVGYRWVEQGDGLWRLVPSGFANGWKMGRPS